MKNTFFIIVLLVVGSVSFLGCKKDDPDADNLTSEATNFTYTLDELGGALITVKNPAKFASYTVDFGDGTSTSLDDFTNEFKVAGMDQYTRKYYYKTNGSYTITISAKESNKGSTSSSQTIAISRVPTTAKIKYFKLKDYPTLNPANNGDWDTDASGPDVTYNYQNYTNLSDNGIIGTSYLNVSKAILPLQLNIDTLSFSVNTSSVNFGCFDNDSPSPNQGITSLNFVIKENTTQGVSYSNGDNSVMYPTILSNSYLEIGIDWIQ